MSEHRSQLLNECRSLNKNEEKALQDFRWKTNGESELSFSQNDNASLNKSSVKGSKFSGSVQNNTKNKTSKPSKQKQDHDDAMSFVSFASDLKSR